MGGTAGDADVLRGQERATARRTEGAPLRIDLTLGHSEAELRSVRLHEAVAALVHVRVLRERVSALPVSEAVRGLVLTRLNRVTQAL